MKIGLIDVDSHNYPNLPLMKISAWHKAKGDLVRWYEPFDGLIEPYDKVYMSKVFSFTEDYIYPIYAAEVEKGGSGYHTIEKDGETHYQEEKNLPEEIEHIYPDYSLYGITDTAYGFLTRGCPRHCGFCIVGEKEGLRSYKVADLDEFWRGQPNIEILDPNILACVDRIELLEELAVSKARINFNQGLDVRFITDEVTELINRIRLKEIHFAWDNYNDKSVLIGLEKYAKKATHKPHGSYATVYVLTNYDTSIEQDLERIYTLRDMNYDPYVMIYNKGGATAETKKVQRWCNNRWIFKSCDKFEDFR